MKEIPILFSTEMVQAILEGRKTITRRTRGLEKVNKTPDKYICAGTYHILTDYHFEAFFINPESMDKIEAKCHYGLPGDVLWVRETWCLTQPKDPETYYFGYKCGIQPYSSFAASEKFDFSSTDKWHPSIHMSKEAARIWLLVEEIRVERLQDISRQDAISEGIHVKYWEGDTTQPYAYRKSKPEGLATDYKRSEIEAFQDLWSSTYGNDWNIGWNANPWVWVVKFKVLSTTGKPNTEPG